MPNKWKIDVENCEFNDKWESTYLFTATTAVKPQCVLCFQVISAMKECNITFQVLPVTENAFVWLKIAAPSDLLLNVVRPTNVQTNLLTKLTIKQSMLNMPVRLAIWCMLIYVKSWNHRSRFLCICRQYSWGYFMCRTLFVWSWWKVKNPSLTAYGCCWY